MADFSAELVKLDARVAAINSELETLLQEHAVHATAEKEAKRRQDDIVEQRMKLRAEREGLSKLRESASANQRIATQEEAATKARQEVDAINARLIDKEKELDALIAKAKEAQPA